MNKVTVTKLVSDKLKTKQAQSSGTGYDGGYGAEPTGKPEPDKSIEPNKQATSVVEPGGLPEKVATSVVEPGAEPEGVEGKQATADQMSAECTCEHCGGTGKTAKKAEDKPETKMEETEETVKKEQTTGGTYDGSYGKAEENLEAGEDETPAKKAKRIQNMPLSKISMDQIFNRVNASTAKPNPKTKEMHTAVMGGFAAKLEDLVKQLGA